MKPPMPQPANDPLSTRYSLLSRLQDWDDAESWREFFDTYWRLIHSVAIRSGLTEDEAQDVVQDTVVSVARSIHNFKRDAKRGSFRGWLRHITRRRIVDQWRKRNPLERAGRRTTLKDLPDGVGSKLEAAWDEEWRTNLIERAAQHLKQNATPEHYQVFHLHVLRELPAPVVAERLGVREI